jgi:glycosyltransferase involved in cell wall biosynthesis
MSATEHRFEADKLMVIIPDRLSDLIRKGEVTERYYNPGELFREVHLVLTNDDAPDRAALQRMVGGARLVVHNLPLGSRYFLRTLGWQKPLIRPFLAQGVALARMVSPQLVRTHNNFLEGVLAREIKEQLGVPFIVSLHGVWDIDDRRTMLARLRAFFRTKLERASLAAADAAIAVYAPIIRYAKAYGARRVELIYNIIAGSNITRKADYALAQPGRLITINRQLSDKNPSNIIRAVAELDCTYTLVGDGPLHDSLRALAAELGCADRVTFVKSMPNAELCASLNGFDLMVSHCDYWGMSKTIIEGALAGLPIIINRHPQIPIPEYDSGWIVECENSPEGYKVAIDRFLGDIDSRRAFGDKAFEAAIEGFDPEKMEKRTVALYREQLSAGGAAST